MFDLRDNLKDGCSHNLDVCCDGPNIKETIVQTLPSPPINSKCGALNPNGVVMRMKETADHEAQFGKVY